jgi:hypothetical protein
MAARGDISAWGAETVHFSFFLGGQNRSSPTDLFRKVFSEEPGSSSENLHIPLGRMGTASTTPVDGRMSTIQLQPGRCDLIFHPSGETVAGGEFPSVEADVLGVTRHAASIAEKLLEELSGITRLALNVRLARYSSDLNECNAAIETVVPVEMALEGVRDFVLQINRPGASGDVGINRILKWACEPIQVIADGPGTPIPGSSTILREFWTAVVHLDYNTIVPHPIFSFSEAKGALSALVDSVATTWTNNLGLE